MGMAASQARLLSITARLADNELRSQTINNAKMRLATQSSQASESYISALNDANLMFSNYDAEGNSQSQLLTYNALTAYSSYNNQYGLVNSSGQLLVSESEADLFEKSNGNLNAYLKSHGLEYTTTYFDQLGNMVNEGYPVPFDVISPETLREMYEAYGSYENSLETDKFEKFYKDYVDADNALKVGSKEIMESYLLSNNNSPKISKDSTNLISIDISGNAQELAQKFKNAFTNSNNTYSIPNLKNMGLTDEGAAAIQEMLDSVSFESSSVGKIEESLPGVYTRGDDGSETIVITDDATGVEITFTKDASGTITVTGNPELSYTDTENPEDNYNYTYTIGSTLLDTVNSLKYDSVEDKHSFNVSLDADGTVDAKSVYKYNLSPSSGDEIGFKQALDELAESILDAIRTTEEYFNYGAFADKLLEWRETGTDLAAKGIDINKVLKSGKTYTEVLDEYKTIKDAYLGFIEVGYKPSILEKSPLEQLIEDGKLTTKDLLDTDKLLKILAENNIAFTNEYKTVIQEFIVESMIEEYGEPKYAWVDENDTANTGNADAKAQWYTNMFNRMKQGYKIIENGLASSSEWLEFALESGLVTMEQVDKSFNWKSLDYKTCSNITEETDNSELVAKAEAEYNRAMKDIDAKDSIYDMELKNIDTEHTALQTEYDSIKSVISKNIERTFKFNQNG